MSIELVARAKKTRLGGNSTAKLLLIALADYANDDGMAWPSVSTLAEEVERDPRTIKRLLRELEAMRLICPGDRRLVSKYAKGRRPNVYRLFPTRKTGETRGKTTETTGDTGVTGDTPDTGDTHDTPQVTSTSPHRCHPCHPTGDTHVQKGVTPMSPKPSIEPPIEPSRESTRANKTKTKPRSERSFEDRVNLLLAFQPTTEQQALADRYGLDCDWELGKFRDSLLGNGKPPYDPEPAFSKWLKTGHEKGIGRPPETTGTPAGKTHRHTFGCTHVLQLLRRDLPDPDELSIRVAELLNQGKTETEALAAMGLRPDELEEIA